MLHSVALELNGFCAVQRVVEFGVDVDEYFFLTGVAA